MAEAATALPALVWAGANPAEGVARQVDLQSGLTRLARYALAGEGRRMLVEETVRLVQGVLDAEVCTVFELLPERREPPRLAGLPVLPVAGAPALLRFGAAPRVTPDGLLIAAIGGPPPSGVMAVQRLGIRLDADEMLFVAGAVDILGVALRRLAGEEEQRHAALHDPLTGLPNRALIFDHLSLALARAPRQPSPVGVLFVDLERFKQVNDTLGHEAGDALLVAVAGRLAGALRPSDTLGRLGGDEFLVVCEDIGGDAEALAVARRLGGAFETPFRLGGRDVIVAASIGVAVSGPGAEEPAALVGKADAAMYSSKHSDLRDPLLFDEWMRPHSVSIALRSEGAGRGSMSGLVARLVGMLENLSEFEGYEPEFRPAMPPH